MPTFLDMLAWSEELTTDDENEIMVTDVIVSYLLITPITLANLSR